MMVDKLNEISEKKICMNALKNLWTKGILYGVAGVKRGVSK